MRLIQIAWKKSASALRAGGEVPGDPSCPLPVHVGSRTDKQCMCEGRGTQVMDNYGVFETWTAALFLLHGGPS